MSYRLILSPKAEENLDFWIKSGQKKTLKKIHALFTELQEHPTSGTGQIEQLRGDFTGWWSRRIDSGNRIIYAIDNDAVKVDIASLKGHYGDK